MTTYNFIDNITSVTVVENSNAVTVGKNLISVEPFGTGRLKITSTSGALTVYFVNINDDVIINGIVPTDIDDMFDKLTAVFFS
jgi:hypothetical protein